MHTKMAQKIEDALLVVRDSYYAKLNNQPFSKFQLDIAKDYLDKVCLHIDNHAPDIEREFLFSCFAILDELIEEDDSAKIYRFAHAIHRVSFIFTGEENWDKGFQREYIHPFCDVYGYELFSELLEMKVPKVTAFFKNTEAGKKTIYRYNEDNIMSLPAYFCFRLMIPLILIPFLIGMMLYVHYADYSETNRGKRYEITVDSFAYEHTDTYDYLYITDNDYEDQFEISRFFELSHSPEELLRLCENKGSLIVYAKYIQHKTNAPYYNVIHLEDTNGYVFRSYEQSNQMDEYLLDVLIVMFIIVFIPSITVFTMMLMVAINPRRYVDHPRFVKFCFPNYSLRVPKQKG